MSDQKNPVTVHESTAPVPDAEGVALLKVKSMFESVEEMKECRNNPALYRLVFMVPVLAAIFARLVGGSIKLKAGAREILTALALPETMIETMRSRIRAITFTERASMKAGLLPDGSSQVWGLCVADKKGDLKPVGLISLGRACDVVITENKTEASKLRAAIVAEVLAGRSSDVTFRKHARAVGVLLKDAKIEEEMIARWEKLHPEYAPAPSVKIAA